MKYIVIVVFLCSVPEVHAAVVGWNNDGSGDYGRECKPPLTFDGEKGVNVRWKAALPNWSNSSPIVIEPADPFDRLRAGGNGPVRVVCLAEPLDYSPILLCFDANTGKELWRRELDAVAAMPKEQQDEARALAKKCWARQRAYKALCVDAGEVYESHKAEWESLPIFGRNGNGYTPEECRKLPPELQPFLERAEEIGCCFTGLTPSWAGRWWLFSFRKNAAYDREFQRMTELGLMWSQWDASGAWDGVAYPTPLSDGKHILTVTAHNLYSCHDLNGKILWQTRFPPPKESDFRPEQLKRLKDFQGKIRWEGGLRGFETSPILAEDLLISNSAGAIRAVDIKTGQSRWVVPVSGQLRQGMAVPAVATVGSERYVIGVSPGNTGGNPILRLRDGLEVGSLTGSVMPNAMNGPIVMGDTIVNVRDKVLVCRRLIRQGDGLTLEERWQSSDNSMLGGRLMRAPWRDGMAYFVNGVFHLREGKPTLSWNSLFNKGYAGEGGILAGGYYLSWNFYGKSGKRSDDSTRINAEFAWVDIVTGKKAGEGSLPVNPSNGLPVTLRREQAVRFRGWMWLGAGTPFAWKDRLYVRANDFLWCIGPR